MRPHRLLLTCAAFVLLGAACATTAGTGDEGMSGSGDQDAGSSSSSSGATRGPDAATSSGSSSGASSGSGSGSGSGSSGSGSSSSSSSGSGSSSGSSSSSGGAGADAGTTRDAGGTTDATTRDAGTGVTDAGSTARDATMPGVLDSGVAPGTLADAAPLGGLAGTAGRPLLTTAQAADYGILQYLARAGNLTTGLVEDDWNPTAGVGDVTTFTPNFTVQAGGQFPTVQSAISAATGTARAFIRVMPGTYREVVCVPANAPPITLYSTNADATQTVIVFNNYSGLAKAVGARANACTGNTTANTFGTAGSASFTSLANGFQAKNLTISNDVSVATLATATATQAVALMIEGDKVILENVRVLGHQDSLLVDTPSVDTVQRTYMVSSFVNGDVDYVFGQATFVMNNVEFQFVSDRRTSGTVFAPNTDARNPYGMLAIGSRFTADSTALNGTVGLGRAWDESCTDTPTYVATCVPRGSYPNGQTVVRSSTLGAHISLTAPWKAAATTSRPFDPVSAVCTTTGGVCPANRLYEFQDTP